MKHLINRVNQCEKAKAKSKLVGDAQALKYWTTELKKAKQRVKLFGQFSVVQGEAWFSSPSRAELRLVC